MLERHQPYRYIRNMFSFDAANLRDERDLRATSSTFTVIGSACRNLKKCVAGFHWDESFLPGNPD